MCLILLKCLIFTLDTRNKILKIPDDNLSFLKNKIEIKKKLGHFKVGGD